MSTFHHPEPFPATSWSLLHVCRDPADEAFRAGMDRLCQRYWPPVFFFVLRHWTSDREKAKDLTQSFFLTFLEKGVLGEFEATRGRFRTFVCAALRHFLANQARGDRAKKRRPEEGVLSLEELRVQNPGFDVADGRDVLDEKFTADWRRAVLDAAVERLGREGEAAGKPYAADLFRRYELEPPEGGRPTYDGLARELGLTLGQVTHGLVWARKRFAALIADEIRDQVASEEDYQAEAKDLFGRA